MVEGKEVVLGAVFQEGWRGARGAETGFKGLERLRLLDVFSLDTQG